MTTEPEAQPPAAPERIYIHPTSMEWRPDRWPLEPEEYTEYVRADLPRAAADDDSQELEPHKAINLLTVLEHQAHRNHEYHPGHCAECSMTEVIANKLREQLGLESRAEREGERS